MTFNEWCEWEMPKEILEGCGEDLRGVLLVMGVTLDPNRARRHLVDYLLW